MVQIEVWLYPNCMASAVCSLMEILRVANALHEPSARGSEMALFSWTLRSLAGQAVMTPAGLCLPAQAAITATSKPDVIVLPGVFLEQGLQVWLQSLQQQTLLFDVLQQQHQRGCLIASNCSASFILAEAGLLAGQRATTSWWLERSFRSRYPTVDLHVDEILCVAPGILTSAAASAYLDLALHLVQQFANPALAQKVARKLLIEPHNHSQMAHRAVAESQPGTWQEPVLIRRAKKWMLQHYQEGFRLSELASHLAVSERTVIRHFQQHLQTTPAQFAQQLKMDLARQLLINSHLSVEQLAQRLGYADANAFRRAFRRICGLTTGQYRQQFVAPQPASEVNHAVMEQAR